MAPKVSDLAVSGTARIVLRPLLETIPGFGAALVSLRTPPIVRFHLDFGRAFGGSSSAAAIRLWLDDFLRNQIAEMMLWPARVVVPILPEDVTGPLDSLYLTCVDLVQAVASIVLQGARGGGTARERHALCSCTLCVGAHVRRPAPTPAGGERSRHTTPFLFHPRFRHRGALRVDVIEARGLPKVDAMGSADSFVTIFTTAHVV